MYTVCNTKARTVFQYHKKKSNQNVSKISELAIYILSLLRSLSSARYTNISVEGKLF